MAEETSGSAGLAAMLDRQRRAFDTPATPASAPPPEAPADAPPEEPPPELTTPPEEPAAEEPAPPAPAPAYRYSSQEEAERAEEEAKRRMHAATEESARFRRQFEALQQKLDALEQRVAEPTPAATPEPTPEPTPAPEVPARKPGESLVAYVERIVSLDPNTDGYHRAVADVYGEMMHQVIREGGKDVLLPTLLPEIEKLMDERAKAHARAIAKEELQQYEQQRTQTQRQQTEQERIWATIVDEGKKVGLDFETDQDVQDYFWSVAAKRADEEFGEDGPMGEKIAAAVARTQRLFGGRTPSTPEPPAPPAPAPAAAEPLPPEDLEPAAPETPAAEPPRRPPQPMGRQSAATPASVGEPQTATRQRSLDQLVESTHLRPNRI